MRISVCMPVFGRPQMVSQALCSILMQSYPNTEIIIQDGNPDQPINADPTVRGLLAVLGSQVDYRVCKDGGIFPAINNCLQRATGSILYFLCSDDLLCPGTFGAVVTAFKSERFGGALWAYGKTISADETGKTLGVDGEPTDFNLLLKHNCIGQPSVFWNREMMNLAGVFDTRFRHAADYDLWLRFCKRREPIFIDQDLGVFRHHARQDTEVYKAEVEQEARAVSWRHRMFSDTIFRARNAYLEHHAYPDGAPGRPPHHFDILEHDPA